MFLSDGIVLSISLQVEFTESLTKMSDLFAVIVLSVLTGMSHMMVMLLCITVAGLCLYHLSVISTVEKSEAVLALLDSFQCISNGKPE